MPKRIQIFFAKVAKFSQIWSHWLKYTHSHSHSLNPLPQPPVSSVEAVEQLIVDLVVDLFEFHLSYLVQHFSSHPTDSRNPSLWQMTDWWMQKIGKPHRHRRCRHCRRHRCRAAVEATKHRSELFFNGPFTTSFYLFSSFVRRWRDSNRGSLLSEATALPTEPQPLPDQKFICFRFQFHLFRFNLMSLILVQKCQSKCQKLAGGNRLGGHLL